MSASKSAHDSDLQKFSAMLPASRQSAIMQRWLAAECELMQLIERLYGAAWSERLSLADWRQQLLGALAAAVSERSEDLYQLDLQRIAEQDWFLSQRSLAYCAYADRFAGSLKGVQDRIPHLKALGVNYLHLLPFLQPRAGENDGGFAVKDFMNVAAELGSNDDLEQLTRALRQQGISLCSDLVLNHVADDHQWAVAARAGDPHYQDYFYHFAGADQVAHWERNLGQIFPQAAPGNFSYIDAMQRYVWTTFYPYQWDLNYRNPSVFLEMFKVMLHLANLGVEAFRLDSTAFLWKREGSNCMNQPEAHWILQAYRLLMEVAAPAVLLKAEAIVETEQLPAYLGRQPSGNSECHIAYHASLMAAGWMSLAEQNTEVLYEVMRSTPILPPHTSWLTYVRCHDDIGWNVLRPELRRHAANEHEVQQRLAAISRFYGGSADGFADGRSFQADDPAAVHGTVGMAAALCGLSRATDELQVQLALRRLLLMYGFMFCFGGMPLIYMGDEYAALNDESYLQDPARAHDSRWLQRPHWDAGQAAEAYSGTGASAAFARQLCSMSALRQRLPVLAVNAARRLLAPGQPALLAIERSLAGQRLIFLANFSDQPHTVAIHLLTEQCGLSADTVWQDVLSGQSFGATISVPAWQQYWLLLPQAEAVGSTGTTA